MSYVTREKTVQNRLQFKNFWMRLSDRLADGKKLSDGAVRQIRRCDWPCNVTFFPLKKQSKVKSEGKKMFSSNASNLYSKARDIRHSRKAPTNLTRRPFLFIFFSENIPFHI